MVLKSNRGKREPWAYEGEIFLVSPQCEQQPESRSSLGSFINEMALETQQVESDSEVEIESSQSLPQKSKIAEESNPKLAPIKYDYKMDIEEKWRNIGAYEGQLHPYEDYFWPLGAEFEQSELFRQMVKSFEVDEWMDTLPFDQVKAFCAEILDFESDEKDQIEAKILRERILWEINGHKSLQSRLILIEQGNQHEDCINAFQIPCRHAKCYKMLDSLRYDRIPIKGQTGDSAFEDDQSEGQLEGDQLEDEEQELVTYGQALKRAKLSKKCRLPDSYEGEPLPETCVPEVIEESTDAIEITKDEIETTDSMIDKDQLNHDMSDTREMAVSIESLHSFSSSSVSINPPKSPSVSGFTFNPSYRLQGALI